MSPEELRDRITAITNAEQRALISFIRQYVHSIDLAEDCLQAAYLEALEHAQEINKPECLLSWLYTVSKRCAIREIAYKSRLMRCCIKFPISRTISTEEELMQNIVLADAITQISRQFPSYYTQVLYLHYIDGLPFRDIATQMGISECAARQACHRMIKALRKYYREKE